MEGSVAGLRRLKDGSLSLMVTFPKGTSMAALEAMGESVEISAPGAQEQTDAASLEALRKTIASAVATIDALMVLRDTPQEPEVQPEKDPRQPDLLEEA